MGRRAGWLWLGIVLCVVAGQAGAQTYNIREQVQYTVSATQANSTVNLGERMEALLINDGPQTVYVNLIGATATTSHFPLAAGESLSSPHRVGPALGFICATGETASVRVLGVGYQLH